MLFNDVGPFRAANYVLLAYSLMIGGLFTLVALFKDEVDSRTEVIKFPHSNSETGSDLKI